MRPDEKEFMRQLMGRLSKGAAKGYGLTLNEFDASFLREILVKKFGVPDSPAIIKKRTGDQM